MSKTIGILGGMGPYATIDFMRMILDLTKVQKESDHIRVIVDNNPRMPSRTRSYLFNETSPVPMLKKGLKNLISAGADFIVVPCNSAHYFLPDVFENIDFPYINMVKETSEYITKEGFKTIGILGGEVTVGAKLYENYLTPVSINTYHVNNTEQQQVRLIIEDVKNGNITESTGNRMSNLVKNLKNNGCDAIVLACTELQAIQRSEKDTIPIIDSLKILAQRAIDFAQK